MIETRIENKHDNSLKRAKRHIFSTGLGDATSLLCRANMVYGIAKIHYAQEELGIEPNATFISGPDETITRNVKRWENGIGYGGKLSWGNGKDKVTILDVMPNACGMLVGGLDELPKPEEIIRKLAKLFNRESFIDDIPVEWDFAKSNHFIDIFNVVRTVDVDLPPYAFIIHSGTPELKADNPKGFGFYVHKSTTLKDMAKNIETPFGDVNVLLDDDATSYLKFFEFANNFSKKKRALAAGELFEDFLEISNALHQGLINYNEVILGMHDIKESTNALFPLSLRADLPAYLFRGKENLTDEVIEVSGFAKRANELGVYQRLKNANVLPHGGGYIFPDILSVVDVMDVDGARYFILDMHNAMGQKILVNPREVQYRYRGREVVVRTLELGLGDEIARLIPEYVLKV